jgi:hypothetical protein
MVRSEHINIYEMYAKHGNRLGFYVKRCSWGNTIAKVVDIEGVIDGEKMSGKEPYFGNPKVTAIYYNLWKPVGDKGNKAGLPCPGTFQYSFLS